MGLKYNPQTGQIESAPLVPVQGMADQILGEQPGIQTVAQIVEQNYPKSIEVPVKSPDGELGYVPTKDIVKAVQSGYEVLDKDQFREEKLEFEYGDAPIRAGILGLARGASFGLSDVAARSLGYEDAVGELLKRNPVASTTGEVVGAVGSAFVPFGAGALIARGSAAAAAKIGAKGLLKAGVVGAVEGAAGGLAQTITEQSLGSTRGVAESLVANVGLGSMLGAGFSGVFYGGAKIANKATSAAAKRMASGEEAMNKVDEFFTGQRSIPAENIDDINRAAQELNIELTPGMKSGSQTYRRLEASLSKSPTYWGNKVAEKIDDAYEKLAGEAENFFEDVTGKTALEYGEELKTRVAREWQHRYDPIQEMYKTLSKDSELITVPADNIKGTISALKRLVRNDKMQSPQKKYIDELISVLSEGDLSVRQLQNIMSNAFDESQKMFRAGQSQGGHIIGRARDSLKRLEERAILRASLENAGHGARGKALAKEMVGQFKEARKQYREFMEMLEDTAKGAKIGKIKSPTQFLQKLEEAPAEKILDRLWDIKDVRKMERFQNNFPDIFDDLITYQKSKILAKAASYNGELNKQVLNVNTLLKEYDKLPKEARLIMFGSDGMKRMDNIRKVFNTLPPHPNPSKSALEFQIQQIWSPTQFVSEGTRYALYKGLPILQEAAVKNQSRITGALNAFFNEGTRQKAVLGTTTAALNVMAPDYKERLNKISEMNNNPLWVMQQMAEDVKGLAQVDPQLQHAVLNQGYAAMQFLNEKAPRKMETAGFLDSDDYDLSDIDIAKFSRYLKAVDDPMSVIDDFAAGLLSPESVEAVERLYPTLMQGIKEKLLERSVKEKKKLTYDQKLMITTLMGSAATQTSDPLFIHRMQQYEMPVEEQPQQPVNKPRKADMSDFDISSRLQTQTSRITMR